MPFQYTRGHGKYDNCTHDHTHQDQSHDNSRVADSAVLHHRVLPQSSERVERVRVRRGPSKLL